jgi:glycosyltransferase involved in cell wall biosynthesis
MSRALKRPRVCFATADYPPTVGGISRSAGRVVGYLADDFDLHVFTFTRGGQADGAPLRPAHERGARVYRIEVPADAPETVWAYRLGQAVRLADDEAAFDLFHCFFLPLAYPCLAVAARGGRPVLASLRGADGEVWLEDEWHRAIVGSVVRRASWVTSVNAEMLDKMDALGLERSRSCVIRNAIAGRSFPRWDGAQAGRGVVGTVGEFRAKKDIPLLVEAYAGLGRGLRRGLLLVGDFSDEAERARVSALVERHGLAAETELTGLVGDEEVSARLLTMSVFVQSSKQDGLPNALLEAAAVGVPLVATAVGGMKDILTHEENALLVEPGDRLGLTAAVEAVLRDERLARRLSEGALRLARSLDPEHEKSEWLGLYERLLRGD